MSVIIVITFTSDANKRVNSQIDWMMEKGLKTPSSRTTKYTDGGSNISYN